MWQRLALFALALASWTLAWGQPPESPGRLLRLSYVEGDVGLRNAYERDPFPLPDRPLMQGDRLITAVDGRAELLLDATAIRLDERTELRITALDAMNVQLGLDRGVADLRLRDLYPDERFEIATGNTRIMFREPGEYRVEARAEDFSVLTIRRGIAEVATGAGLVRVADGQRVVLEGRDSRATLVPPVEATAFDDWILEREVQLASANMPAGPEYGDSYDPYDGAGIWYDDATYGHVWMADYSYGYAPWTFFAFSDGRWAFLVGEGRWCWVPDRPTQLPQFARETHPYGRAKGSRGDGDGTAFSVSRSSSSASSGRSFFGSFGSGRSSYGSASGSSSRGSSTMRSSGSYGRPRSSSSSSMSRSTAFGVPR